MSNNKIIAICGASAAGKDSLARWLKNILCNMGYDAETIVSATTRPKRNNEQDGEDYYFWNQSQFAINEMNQKFLETTEFNGWKYGTLKDSINHDINIGVFNPQGIAQINKDKNFDVFIVYLKEPLTERIVRSYKREHKFQWEYIRRALADSYAFKDFEKYLTLINNYVIIEQIDGVIAKSYKIINYMTYTGFLGKKE